MGLVAAAGTAIATFAAVDTIAAVGFTLTAALEVTAAIGGALSVIGIVTGNKDLATAGMALGIVGGVGSLASSAGLFGEAANTAPLFGEGATSLADTSAAATDAGTGTFDASQIEGAATAGTDPGAATSAAATDVGNGSGDIINSIGEANPNAVLPTTAEQAQTAQAAGNASDIVTGGDQTTPLSSALTQSDTSAAPPQQAGIPQGAGTAPSVPGVAAPPSPADPVTGLPETLSDVPPPKPAIPGGAFDGSIAAQNSGGVLDTITGFAQNNKLATYGLIQAAGSFAQGAFSPVTPAQVNALNAQAAANNAAAKLTATQAANINSGVPSSTVNRPVQSPPVTGKPQGLINTQAA